MNLVYYLIFLFHISNLFCPSSSKRIETEQDVADYLTRFGYLDFSLADRIFIGHSQNATNPEEIAIAIKVFQNFFGLPDTGKIDTATKKLMNRPRCANPETLQNQVTVTPPKRSKRFALSNYSWRKHDITYRISRFPKSFSDNAKHNVKDADQTQLVRNLQHLIEQEIVYAFSLWSEIVELNFIKSDSQRVDIDIQFVEGEHGDDYEFDGPTANGGFMIAHAFNPNPKNPLAGDIHFDSEETWVLGNIPEDDDEALHFRWGAIHEIGHALGLQHSNEEYAYMYPMYPSFSYEPETPLHADDIIGIEALYAPVFTTTPVSSNKAKTEATTPTTTTIKPSTRFVPQHPTKPSQPRDNLLNVYNGKTYSNIKLKQFTDTLSEILFAINPTSASPDQNNFVCKQKKPKHFNKMSQASPTSYLCIPEKYVL